MIYQGDCLDILPTLETKSVQCVITSPPYYGLRDYGTAKWEGGDEDHEHDRVAARNGRGGSGATGKQTADAYPNDLPAAVCSCGATRIDSQIGLESIPEIYVEKLVAVFRELRRVLRDDGTVWLNLGDSYNGSGKAGSNPEYQAKHTEFGKPSKEKSRFGMPTNIKALKPKDLIGIPWRVAFALQADGWWLRQDVIWHKPNPMPESVSDRCTKSHEYIFLLTKSAKYFYDADAIREPQNGTAHSRGKGITPKSQPMGQGIKANNSFHAATALWHKSPDSKRNRRSVWVITTRPYRGAHFAVFPPEIPEICIKAGSKAGDTILDPFAGTGTTGLVAEKLGRKFVGIELNPEYVDMAERRINSVQHLLLAVR